MRLGYGEFQEISLHSSNNWFGFFAALAVLSFAMNLSAQTVSLGDEVSRPIPGVGHDYIHGVSETVSPSNGSLNIKIDLPSPKGRGLSLPLAVTYNSGNVHGFLSWKAGVGSIDSAASSPINYYYASNRAQVGFGWSDNVPYVTFSGYSVPQPGGPGYQSLGWCPVTSSYNFYDSNGGSHMLGLAALGVAEHQEGGPAPQQGCMNMISGGPTQYGGDDEVKGHISSICNGNYVGVTYPAECTYAMPSFTVTDLNGTTYSFQANSGQIGVGECCNQTFPATINNVFPTKIEDRNGNIIQFTPPTGGYPSPGSPMTDTLGRNVSFVVAGTGTYVVGGLSYTETQGTATASFTSPSMQVYPLGSSHFTCDANFTASDTATPYSVVSSLSLPNGQAYTFKYDQTYGLVNEIDYPNGGWVKYSWGFPGTYSTLASFDGLAPDGVSSVSGACDFLYSPPVITQRQVGYSHGSGPALTQTFQYSTVWDQTNSDVWDSKTTTVTTLDNVTGKQAITKYTYAPVDQPIVPGAGGQQPSQIPVETQVQTFDWGNNTTPLQTVNKTWQNQFEMTSEQTILNNGQSTATIYCGGAERPTEVDEYDYGVPTPTLSQGAPGSYPVAPVCGTPTPSRRTVYGYFLGLSPCQTIVYGSTGLKAAETDVYLDGGSSPCLSGQGGTQPVSVVAGTHDETNHGSGTGPARGNATAVVRWLNTGYSVTTTAAYDETGQIVSMTDPCGNTGCSDIAGMNHTTTYSYADNPSGGNGAGQSNAYLTRITSPSVNGMAQQNNFAYNYVTGNVVSSTDPNNQTTGYQYNDSLSRLTETDYPDGGKTTIGYNDSVPSVTTTVSAAPDPNIVNVSITDGLGHVVQTQLPSDPEGTDFVDTSVDGMGRLYTSSNPHRPSSSSTDGTSSYTYDALGRPKILTHPDGTTLQWTYTGNCTISTDEVGNSWTRCTDALGRLISVLEPGGLPTSYSYDPLGNLLNVTQTGVTGEAARIRSFVYDSLSRLTSASNPETGTVTYNYDANGNLTLKTDARGAWTQYAYDALNRLTDKYFSDGLTPNQHFRYEQTSTWMGANYNTIGRLSEAYTDQDRRYYGSGSPPACNPQSSSTSNYNPAYGNPVYCEWTDELYSYDAMGHQTRIATAFPSEGGWNAHEIDLNYDLAGKITSLRYPDGRVVTQAWDGAGHQQTSAFDNWNGQHVGYTYASGLTYTPAGSQAEVTFGNGVYVHTPYNNRLQMCQVWAQNAQALIDTHIYFGGSTIYCNSTPGNNGNITQIKDWRNPNNTRYFGYDALNRLSSFSNGDGSMQQSYTIDSFGNMSQSGTLSSSLGFGTENQINSGGYNYDAAGNLTSFTNVFTTTYAFDAESKMFSVNSGGGYYTYDAAGERMRKDANGGFTEYQYLNGQPIAEKNSGGTWSDYIYANGQKIARADSYNRYIQFTGSFSSVGNYGEVNFAPASSQIDGQYVIQTGDKLTWKQNQSQAYGGVYFFTTDGTNGAWTLTDQNGEYGNDSMSTDGNWHSRVVDLSPFAGKTVSSVQLVAEGNSPAGNWTLQYADISIVAANGTVLPIYNGATGVSGSPWGTAGYTFGGMNVQSVSSATGDTVYYTGDQIGSTRMVTSSDGWPISSDIFYPFGQEQTATTDPNHYKFTGKERDTESGLDYFGARYYGSTMGRWMSPDWAAKPEAVAYSRLITLSP